MEILINPSIQVRPYKYCIARDIFFSLLEREKDNYEKILIVADENVDKLFLSECKFEKLVIGPGETSKSFEMLEKLINEFSLRELKRNSLVVAFGGGVVGDLVGFAASVYMRGIDYWQVPTTLVAMVDSAIGGKTGINTKHGKNLAGAFYHPKKIVADLSFLDKLPENEVKAGLAEMYKHCLISDKSLLDSLIEDPKSVDAVAMSAKVKIDIIERDVNEKLERKYLNVGHTIAHAIEKESNLEVGHGKAVAIGIKMESILANRLGILSDENLEVVLSGLKKIGIDYEYKIKDLKKFLEYMKQDKKNVSDKISFALVEIPGEKIALQELSCDQLTDFLESYA
jgi:3-dehydroquinate synthase